MAKARRKAQLKDREEVEEAAGPGTERPWVRSRRMATLVRPREAKWLEAVAAAWETAPATVLWLYMHAAYSDAERLAASVEPCEEGLVAAVVAARRLGLRLTGLEEVARGPRLAELRQTVAAHPEAVPTAELRRVLASAGVEV